MHRRELPSASARPPFRSGLLAVTRASEDENKYETSTPTVVVGSYNRIPLDICTDERLSGLANGKNGRQQTPAANTNRPRGAIRCSCQRRTGIVLSYSSRTFQSASRASVRSPARTPQWVQSHVSEQKEGPSDHSFLERSGLTLWAPSLRKTLN